MKESREGGGVGYVMLGLFGSIAILAANGTIIGGVGSAALSTLVTRWLAG